MKKYTKAAGLFVSIVMTSAVLSGTVTGQATAGRKAGTVNTAQAADQSSQSMGLDQSGSFSTNSRKAG